MLINFYRFRVSDIFITFASAMRNMLFILFIAPLLVLCGCSGNGDDPDLPAADAPRAVLVYMVANNSLGSANYDSADINEMLIAAKNGDFGQSRLFVYHHARNAAPVLKEITAEGQRTLLTYDANSSSVSVARMKQVINDFCRLVPAQRRGLILWSHGSGWIENGIQESGNAISTLSFGDDGGRYMNVTSLRNALSDKLFDFIYFDCCYMAGVEVAYELRYCTDAIVGSVTELPSPGMPYDESLRYLLLPEADLVGAASATFDFYNAKSGEARTCTISVINTAALDDLADATRAIYMANNINSPGFSPQRFMTSACYLYDFGQYVDDLAADLPQLKASFDKALADVVLFKASTPRLWDLLAINHHSGLSTFIPNENQAEKYHYSNLQWASDVAAALYK